MKIVLAPDKFKNSLTGLQFCNAVIDGIHSVCTDIDILKLPLADGGDGTIEVVNYYLKGEHIDVAVSNPFFEKVIATYLYASQTQTAFIEMAEASGVKLLSEQQLDCKNATSLGTGEMIVDAINKGATTIILGIGGSATNDCGMGMATALGYQFLDKNRNTVHPIGANLSRVVTIDASAIHPGLANVNFEIACDVKNPLYGTNGAAQVYAAQKGATRDDITLLDQGLKDIAQVIENHFNINPQLIEGAGAAGGMGIAAKIFLNGKLSPGIDLIKSLSDFDNRIKDADWIITGEGKLDSQTLSGKTIQGVITSAKRNNSKVAAFCGAIDLDKIELEQIGIVYAASVMEKARDLNDAFAKAEYHLQHIASTFATKYL